MSLTPEQLEAMVDYYIVGGSTKAILEDDETGLFEGVSREEIAEGFDEFETILRDKIEMETMFAQEEADAQEASQPSEPVEDYFDNLWKDRLDR